MENCVNFKNASREYNDPFGCSFKVKYRELTGFLHQIPLKSISFVIASVIMLSGCGGGGGGGSSKTTVSTPFEFRNQSNREALPPKEKSPLPPMLNRMLAV